MRNEKNLCSENMVLGLSLFYIYVGRALIDAYGLSGDAAVRNALVDYATGRSLRLRKIHQSLGMKTNLYNFANYQTGGYSEDSYAEGSFYKASPCRDSHDTVRCTFVEEMIKRGERELAVTYCEEVHPPLWQAYAPTAIVNLGKTLAQEGSTQCLFDVFLRPGRMTPEQRAECFEEFDPDFKGDRREEYVCPTHQESTITQFMFMFNAYYKIALNMFDAKAVDVIVNALPAYLDDYVNSLKASTAEFSQTFDKQFIDDNCLFSSDIELDKVWDEGLQEVKSLAREHIYLPINALLNR